MLELLFVPQCAVCGASDCLSDGSVGDGPAGEAKLPKNYTPDGEDMTAAILGESPARTKPLFWEYGRNNTSFAYPQDAKHRSPNVAVRDGDWKLLVNADGTGAELYDLANDANETKNVAADHPDVAKRLAQKAIAWRKSVP